MRLRRYWISFDQANADVPLLVRLGCGVTAWNAHDALSIVRHHVFQGRDFSASTVVEDVDISTLDAKHFLPNMAVPTMRGIWYPLGYQ
jgi:hypothetical protein